MSMPSKRTVLAWLGLAALLAPCGCQVVPESFGSSSVGVPFRVPGYADRAPIEIVLLPIPQVDALPATDANLLREEIYRVLLGKSYTPVNPSFSDAALAPVLSDASEAAGEPPAIGELNRALATDGFLAVRMVAVERRPGNDSDVLRLRARAVLYDADGGTVLFDHELDLSYKVTAGTAKTLSGSELDKTLSNFATRLLGPLPARKSAPPGLSRS